MENLRQKIEEAVVFVRSRAKLKPAIAIILGTGLGALAKKIQRQKRISYDHIPHFPISTGPGHEGFLVFGEIAGKRVVAMQGRFHYYEGYSLEEVTFGVRVMAALGTKILIVSNASGGMNPQFQPGDLMLISDHINLMGVNPLIGPNDNRLGPRFPDMCGAYNRELCELTEKVALEEGIKLQKGVYVGVTGPNLETPAEYRFLRTIGADAVGMSTVPEVLVAVHSGLKVLGVGCITDSCLPDALQPANIEEILKVAAAAEPKLARLIFKVIAKLK